MSVEGGIARIVTNGLVFNLNATDRNSYVSGSTIWYDMSGNGNNGTLISGSTFNSTNGGAIVFDGIDDYVSITETSNMTPQILTLECIFEVNSTTNTTYGGAPASAQYIAFRQNTRTSNFEGYELVFDETNSRVQVGVSTSAGVSYLAYSTTSSVSIGNTYIVSGVIDSTLISIYINGQFNTSLAKATGIDYNVSHTLKLGRSVPTGTTFDTAFNGQIYNFKLYNRALSADEILQNYNAQKARFGLQ